MESISEFTGERAVEELTPNRIWLDHVARYEFAVNYVKNKNTLDIACGTGFGSKILKNNGAKEVIGIDLSEDAVNFAKEKYISDGIQFYVGDIINIELPDKYFDAIVSFETIEHVSNQIEALCELKRVLKPNGLLIISSPNRRLTSPGKSLRDPPNNAFHKLEYTFKEFIHLLSSYFTVCEIYGQRPISKIFLLPVVERILRHYYKRLFRPDSGTHSVEKLRFMLEYRYIVLTCLNEIRL